jgi:outer membrane receptor protein involved in Fe transport
MTLQFAAGELAETSACLLFKSNGVSRNFSWSPELKPVTLRFDIVNLFDKIYELRDGSGIGVFAPKFGARRGFYAGISQKL